MIGLRSDYVGVCAGNRLVGRQQKRWIDTVKGFGCQASKENGEG